MPPLTTTNTADTSDRFRPSTIIRYTLDDDGFYNENNNSHSNNGGTRGGDDDDDDDDDGGEDGRNYDDFLCMGNDDEFEE